MQIYIHENLQYICCICLKSSLGWVKVVKQCIWGFNPFPTNHFTTPECYSLLLVVLEHELRTTGGGKELVLFLAGLVESIRRKKAESACEFDSKQW